MRKLLPAIVTWCILVIIILTSCVQQKKEILPEQTAPVTRGDLILAVSSDGNLDMPHEVQLKFGTPGTVKEIPAENYKGKLVKAGTLLAKLDDTTELLNVEAAQYSVELALNNVLQSCCGTRYPTFYSLATALMRFEQAQNELDQARSLLIEKEYYNSSSHISLAKYDLEAARSVYADPKLDTLQTQYTDIQQKIDSFPEFKQIVAILDEVIEKISSAQSFIDSGDYSSAIQELDSLSATLEDTRGIIKNNSRLPGAYTYPDTSTSLAISRQALDLITELQGMLTQDDFDRVKFSEKLRMAEHDLLMANMVLDENETVYRAGLNPQLLRTYNINIETALINLDKAKQELLKTEILAPFDGTVVAVDVKINDQLSQFDYASKTAVHLVDTKTVRMTGIIDEIDITKVDVGQEAVLTVDALPGRNLTGKVTFVSPFGTLQSGVVNFPVEIYLDPADDVELRGGLTATADIIIGKRENVLMVPNRAIKGLSGDYWVDVVINLEKAVTEKRPVKTGLQNKRLTEILSGVKEGEVVLVETVK